MIPKSTNGPPGVVQGDDRSFLKALDVGANVTCRSLTSILKAPGRFEGDAIALSETLNSILLRLEYIRTP